MINFVKKYSNLLLIVFSFFMIFVLIHQIIDTSILESSVYNSYELQAKAWLKGQVFLDHNYEYLEIAIYNGHYFVSFPPFPSVFLLPFVIIFGDSIPTNLISFIIFCFCFIIMYKIMKKKNFSEMYAIMMSLAFTVGTNLISLSMNSGVWFIAQSLNYLLCLLAIYAFLNNKKYLVYLCLAFAVGCRPFSIIYMLMFFIYYLVNDKEEKFLIKLKKNIIPLIPSIIIGMIYMWYNYIRFDNVLEFGHNYLPEFLESPYGQFNFHYLLPNLKDFLFNGITVDKKLHLRFMMPFSLFIANPIFIIYICKTIKNFYKTKKVNFLRLLIMIFTFFNIMLICLHKTLGGWQFGARYSIDILPFIFLSLISFNDLKKNKEIGFNKIEILIIVFGIILNVFGVILYFTNKT